MEKKTVKIIQVIAVFQIATFVLSQNVFASEISMVNDRAVAVVDALATSNGTPAPTATQVNPDSADAATVTIPPLPGGYTRAASNMNFAFRFAPLTGIDGKSLRLLDLRTGAEQTLAGYAFGTYGDNIFKVYDASPDGQFVVFADKDGSEARIQSIDNPTSKVSVRMDYGLNQIEWAGTGSTAKVILTNLGGSQRKTVLLSNLTLISELPTGYTQAKSNVNYAFQVRATGAYGKRLVLRDLNTGVEQTLAGYSIATYGDNIFKVFDVSPDGKFVAFSDKDGSVVRIQAIDHPANGKSIPISYGLNKIEWKGVPHPNHLPELIAIFTNLGGSQKIKVDYISGVLTSLNTAFYSSTGKLVEFARLVFYPDGKVHKSSDYTYTNGVETALHRYVYNPNGTLLAQIRRFYYPNGQISKTWNDSYKNGARSVLHYYQFDVNGKLTGWETVKFSLTSGLVVSRTKWYLT